MEKQESKRIANEWSPSSWEGLQRDGIYETRPL